MSKYIDELIYDRTQDDLNKLTKKAYIDYSDLNRIETAIKWVSYVLNKYGYKNTVKVKVNWNPEDLRTDREMERIRQNIIAIRQAYYTNSSTPLTPNKITYISIYQANAIEQIIHDVGVLIETSFPGPQFLSFGLGKKAFGNRSINI